MSFQGKHGNASFQHFRQRSYDLHSANSSNMNPHISRAANRSSSTILQLNDQQIAYLFEKSPTEQANHYLPPTNSYLKTINDIYNDDTIYTEPTIVEPKANYLINEINAFEQESVQIPSTFVSHPTSCNLQQETDSVTQFQSNLQSFPGCDENYETSANKLVNLDVEESSEKRPRAESLTITGHDLAITLSNGEITQTLLNTAPQAQMPDPNMLYYLTDRIEFLPLCDLLFNIISLAAYFCDVVFDSVTAYTLYLNGQNTWFIVSLAIILISTVTCQFLSYRWHLRDRKNLLGQLENVNDKQQLNCCSFISSPSQTDKFEYSPILLVIHIFLGGVLWRYFKLFAPVNLANVKYEVSDLCLLRMVHAFCEAGPMLLLQMYLIWTKPSFNSITDLNIISIFLSLFSICWALSSFSKNIRKDQIHKLVLTWLGVIFQFLWRLGTITSRVVALTIYATLYEKWLFAVLFLHWFSMFFWLLSPGIHTNLSSANENNNKSPQQRITQGAILAWIYIFCFVNLDDTKPRYRMVAFYSTMFLENVLLLSIALFFDVRSTLIPWYRTFAIILVLGFFLIGMGFMWIYYHFFHICHLKTLSYEGSSSQGGLPHSTYLNSEENRNHMMHHLQSSSLVNSKLSPACKLTSALVNQCYSQNSVPVSGDSSSNTGRRHFSNDNIPGVFNCRLNPALKRKKKKPSMVPPLPQSYKNSELKNYYNNTLAPINEFGSNISHDNKLQTTRPTYQRRNSLNQTQRLQTKSNILNRTLKNSSADLFWRKSNLSARSLSISPSTMLKSSENLLSLPAKHPFSSTITTPTSPINLLPTENFIDKLNLELDLSRFGEETKKELIRPKPIVQQTTEMEERCFLPNEICNQANDQLVNYYYHPYYRQVKVRTQTPEVLLKPYNDSRVFYDYPSVVAIPQTNLMGAHNGVELAEYNKEFMFMEHSKRPPVPGQEDKGSENDNSSYVEGKRSLVNYGLSTAKLEKIVENKTENADQDAIHFSRTLPNESRLRPKSGKTARCRGKKNIPIVNRRVRKRAKQRAHFAETNHSFESTTDTSSASSVYSSGDEADIESDINQSTYNSTVRVESNLATGRTSKVSNLYSKVSEECDTAFESSKGIECDSANSSPTEPVGIGGATHLSRIARGRVSFNNEHSLKSPSAKTIANYHLASSKFSGQPTNLSRIKPLYHSAKYKRHNTPL